MKLKCIHFYMFNVLSVLILLFTLAIASVLQPVLDFFQLVSLFTEFMNHDNII